MKATFSASYVKKIGGYEFRLTEILLDEHDDRLSVWPLNLEITQPSCEQKINKSLLRDWNRGISKNGG